ncbi:MAG: DUF2239 family protein [Acidobacteriota bacterium]
MITPSPSTATNATPRLIAFAPDRRLAAGTLAEVATGLRGHLETRPEERILVFDAATSRPVELDLSGSVDEVAARYRDRERQAKADAERPAPKRRGRPKLGVVGREVTLLPRHWRWLAAQPGGASVTLRKLVDQARRDGAGAEEQRRAQEATYRFMLAMAGDRPGYEEALRALYAGRRDDFVQTIDSWPGDVREHTLELAAPAFADK